MHVVDLLFFMWMYKYYIYVLFYIEIITNNEQDCDQQVYMQRSIQISHEGIK